MGTGSLSYTSGNATELKNKQNITLLFLSTKEPPDNDLLNKDLKVVLLSQNLIIKVWVSCWLWFWRKQTGFTPWEVTWVQHLLLQFLTGCSHPDGMMTDYFPPRFLLWAPWSMPFGNSALFLIFQLLFQILHLMFRAAAFLGKPWKTLHLTPSSYHKRT